MLHSCVGLTWLVVVGVLAVAATAAAGMKCDQEQTDENGMCGTGGLQMYVGKKGGVIRVYRKDDRKGKKTDEIKVYIDSITEVNANGSKVTGGKKHSIEEFNKVAFEITAVKNQSLAPNVHADCLICNGSLLPTGVEGYATLTVCILNSNGPLAMGNETTTLTAGQLKFSFALSWPNLDPTSAFLDVDIDFKIPPGRDVKPDGHRDHTKPVRFSLGGDATADFATKVLVDEAWLSMPDGYPKYAQKGANNVITLRLPKFAKLALYDPTINPGEISGSGAASRPDAGLPVAVGILLLLGHYLLARL